MELGLAWETHPKELLGHLIPEHSGAENHYLYRIWLRNSGDLSNRSAMAIEETFATRGKLP